MPPPEWDVLAEGHLPAGQHWILRAGGTPSDFAAPHPQVCELVSVTAIGPDGSSLESRDLSRHEAA